MTTRSCAGSASPSRRRTTACAPCSRAGPRNARPAAGSGSASTRTASSSAASRPGPTVTSPRSRGGCSRVTADTGTPRGPPACSPTMRSSAWARDASRPRSSPATRRPCASPPAPDSAVRAYAGSSRAWRPRRDHVGTSSSPGWPATRRSPSRRAFRALLNSFLPRKRAISQLLVRDREGRVLICQLTYKRDWDLPGGVVEVGESPRLAAGREIDEELALDIEAGRPAAHRLAPALGRLGRRGVPGLRRRRARRGASSTAIVLQAREIRQRRVRDRRAGARAVRRLHGPPDRARPWPTLAAGGGAAYVESGGARPSEPAMTRTSAR